MSSRRGSRSGLAALAALAALAGCGEVAPLSAPLVAAAAERDVRAPEFPALVRARRAFAQGEYREALDWLAHARAERPDEAAVWALQAETQRLLGAEGAAHAAARRAATLAPEDADAALAWGRAAQAVGEHAEADEAFRRAARLRPAAVAPWRALAELHAEQRRSIEAEQALAEALQRAPDDPDLWALRGRLDLDAGRWEAARDRWQRVLVAAPAHAGARAGLIALFEGRGEYDRALAVADGWPGRPPAAEAHRGRLLAALGRRDEAIRALDAALAAEPRRADLRLLLAQALVAADRPARALAVLAPALGTDPAPAVRDCWRAAAPAAAERAASLDERRAAAGALAQALALDPRWAPGLLAAALLRAAETPDARAVELAQQAEQAGAPAVLVRLFESRVFEERRWWSRALDAADRALALLEPSAAPLPAYEVRPPGGWPAHPRAALDARRGRCLAALGRADEAAAAFTRALALTPDDAPSRLALGALRLAAGRFEDAETALVAAAQSGDDDTRYEAFFRLGELDERRQLYGDAARWYRLVAGGLFAGAAHDRLAHLTGAVLAATIAEGRRALDEGRLPRALRAADEARAIDEGAGAAWLLRGEALEALGHVDPALAAYERAGEHAPDSGAWLAAALRWADRGEWTRARDRRERHRRAGAPPVPLEGALDARLAAAEGRPDEALAAFVRWRERHATLPAGVARTQARALAALIAEPEARRARLLAEAADPAAGPIRNRRAFAAALLIDADDQARVAYGRRLLAGGRIAEAIGVLGPEDTALAPSAADDRPFARRTSEVAALLARGRDADRDRAALLIVHLVRERPDDPLAAVLAWEVRAARAPDAADWSAAARWWTAEWPAESDARRRLAGAIDRALALDRARTALAARDAATAQALLDAARTRAPWYAEIERLAVEAAGLADRAEAGLTAAARARAAARGAAERAAVLATEAAARERWFGPRHAEQFLARAAAGPPVDATAAALHLRVAARLDGGARAWALWQGYGGPRPPLPSVAPGGGSSPPGVAGDPLRLAAYELWVRDGRTDRVLAEWARADAGFRARVGRCFAVEERFAPLWTDRRFLAAFPPAALLGDEGPWWGATPPAAPGAAAPSADAAGSAAGLAGPPSPAPSGGGPWRLVTDEGETVTGTARLTSPTAVVIETDDGRLRRFDPARLRAAAALDPEAPDDGGR